MFFEFHPTCCVVQDAITKEVILSGFECGGIYKLDFRQLCGRIEVRNMQCNNYVIQRVDTFKNHLWILHVFQANLTSHHLCYIRS